MNVRHEAVIGERGTYVCIYCNDANEHPVQLWKSMPCPDKHSMIRERPPIVMLIQGLIWAGTLLFIALWLEHVLRIAHLVIVVVAMAFCWMQACSRSLLALRCPGVGFPASSIAEQLYAEAIGIFVSLVAASPFALS